MDAWRELYRLAARQHRCVTVWQTDEIGLARRTLENRARPEHWERPYRGVLVVPGAPRSYAQEVGAALLSTRPSGVAACEAAAYLHNLVTKPARPVPVAVRDGRHRRAQPGRRLLRPSGLLPLDVRAVDRLDVTSPVWTLCDLAYVLSDAGLAQAIATADRLRLATLS